MKWWIAIFFPFCIAAQDLNGLAEDLEYTSANEIDIDESEFKNHWDINKISEQELLNLGILSKEQIQNFLNYRNLLGPFLAKEELRAIPGFDDETIKKVLEWLEISKSNSSIGKPERIFFTRWNTTAPLKRGYQKPASYLGSPHYLSHHFRYKIPGKWSAGFGIEKDQGEKFGDSWNFHIAGNNVSKSVKSLVIGDFMVQMGQGLISRGGFGGSFSLNPALILKTGNIFRPVTGLSEGYFFRGAGITFGKNAQWDISIFFSLRLRDSNRLFSSLGTSGYHRTSSEIEYKNSVRQFTEGIEFKKYFENGHISGKGLWHQLSKPLSPVVRPYSQFRFSGSTLFNGSIDFSYLWKGIRFTGEWAFDSSFKTAWISTLNFSPDKKLDLAFSFRNYGVGYKSLESDGFGKNTGTQNERGLFILGVFKPSKNWEISGMYDQRNHPWLKFNVHSPSIGQTGRLRATWSKKRGISAYLEYYFDKSEQNIDQRLVGQNLSRIRLSSSIPLTPTLEWRSRFDGANLNKNYGTLFFQDLIFKPQKIPFDLKIRWAVVDTYGYDLRFYAYEQHLSNTFSMPAYFGNGHRWYVLTQYKKGNLTLEFKTAHSQKSGKNPFGSGNEGIIGNVKWDFFGQIIYRW